MRSRTSRAPASFATTRSRGMPRRRAWLLLALAVGSVDCVGGSDGDGDAFDTSAYVVNLTREAVNLELWRVQGSLDCDALEASAAEAEYASESCRLIDLGHAWP